MRELKILDNFAGIGTFSYAFEETGKFKTVAFCEMDTDCHRVLRKHWPRTNIFTDVATLRFVESEGSTYLIDREDVLETGIDVIVGGFPCTDVSVAGKQKGFNDEGRVRELIEKGMSRQDAEIEARTRSGLWTEYKRLIGEIKPRWVVIENVRNLLSNGFAIVIKDLSELGYDAEWEVISARDVGQCHLRERVWIVAYPNCEQLRNRSEWSTLGRNDIQAEGESESGHSSAERRTRLDEESFTDSDSDRRKSGLSLQARDERENLQSLGNGERRTAWDNHPRFKEWDESTHTDNFRFWPTFASQEAASRWWSEATAQFSDWREAQPDVHGVYDGPTSKLHEKFRRARIKQLGNGVVRSIPRLIADRIVYHETKRDL